MQNMYMLRFNFLGGFKIFQASLIFYFTFSDYGNQYYKNENTNETGLKKFGSSSV